MTCPKSFCTPLLCILLLCLMREYYRQAFNVSLSCHHTVKWQVKQIGIGVYWYQILKPDTEMVGLTLQSDPSLQDADRNEEESIDRFQYIQPKRHFYTGTATLQIKFFGKWCLKMWRTQWCYVNTSFSLCTSRGLKDNTVLYKSFQVSPIVYISQLMWLDTDVINMFPTLPSIKDTCQSIVSLVITWAQGKHSQLK